MRREMSTLKKQIEDVQGTGRQPASQLQTTQLAPATYNVPMGHSALPEQKDTIFNEPEEAIAEEYIEVEKEPETLNLNELGRQMLEKALERNNGNRKKAAQELGISDRTLYRRLKQFLRLGSHGPDVQQ